MASKAKEAKNPEVDGEEKGEDGEEEFVVEKVVDIRIKGGKRQYQQNWNGYPE